MWQFHEKWRNSYTKDNTMIIIIRTWPEYSDGNCNMVMIFMENLILWC